jgi:hypothetical protein
LGVCVGCADIAATEASVTSNNMDFFKFKFIFGTPLKI